MAHETLGAFEWFLAIGAAVIVLSTMTVLNNLLDAYYAWAEKIGSRFHMALPFRCLIGFVIVDTLWFPNQNPAPFS